MESMKKEMILEKVREKKGNAEKKMMKKKDYEEKDKDEAKASDRKLRKTEYIRENKQNPLVPGTENRPIT